MSYWWKIISHSFITKSMRDFDIETYMTNVKQVTTFVNGEILKSQRHCGVNC